MQALAAADRAHALMAEEVKGAVKAQLEAQQKLVRERGRGVGERE